MLWITPQASASVTFGSNRSQTQANNPCLKREKENFVEHLLLKAMLLIKILLNFQAQLSFEEGRFIWLFRFLPWVKMKFDSVFGALSRK